MLFFISCILSYMFKSKFFMFLLVFATWCMSLTKSISKGFKLKYPLSSNKALDFLMVYDCPRFS